MKPTFLLSYKRFSLGSWLAAWLAVGFLSCSSPDPAPKSIPAIISTDAVVSITTNKATAQGNLTFAGNTPIKSIGFVFSTLPNATKSDNYTTNGNTSLGKFSNDLVGLSPKTTYYVRAYAINGEFTSYGQEITFKTN